MPNSYSGWTLKFTRAILLFQCCLLLTGSGKTATLQLLMELGFSSNVTSGNNGLNFEGQNNSVPFTVNKTERPVR
jgi:hypothetical protein